MCFSKLSLSLLCLATLTCIAPVVQAQTIIDFEDLTGSGSFTTTYHGIDFEPNVWNYFSSNGSPYNPHSGTERTFQSGSEVNPYFTFVTPTEFQGLWVSGQSFASAQLFLYDTSNTLVATSGIVPGSATPQFLSSGYNGLVNKVIINTPQADYVVFDDLTLGSSTAAVPEPGALALLVTTGLSGAGLLFRKRRRK